MRNRFNDASGITVMQTVSSFFFGAIPAAIVGVGAGFLTKLLVVGSTAILFGAGAASAIGGVVVLFPALVGGAIGAAGAGAVYGREGLKAGAIGGLVGAGALTYLTVSGIANAPDIQQPRVTQTTSQVDVAPVIKAPLQDSIVLRMA